MHSEPSTRTRPSVITAAMPGNSPAAMASTAEPQTEPSDASITTRSAGAPISITFPATPKARAPCPDAMAQPSSGATPAMEQMSPTVLSIPREATP